MLQTAVVVKKHIYHKMQTHRQDQNKCSLYNYITMSFYAELNNSSNNSIIWYIIISLFDLRFKSRWSRLHRIKFIAKGLFCFAKIEVMRHSTSETLTMKGEPLTNDVPIRSRMPQAPTPKPSSGSSATGSVHGQFYGVIPAQFVRAEVEGSENDGTVPLLRARQDQ